MTLEEWEAKREVARCRFRRRAARRQRVTRGTNNVFEITMVDESALERVARALCAAEFPDVSPQYAWNVQFEDGQCHYRALALAALKAAVNGT